MSNLHVSFSQGVFVTGTDTGVGKTVASCALLAALSERGLTTVAMKPVASGCVITSSGLRNEDAQALQMAGTIKPDYALVNPYAFPQAIAPHLAASAVGAEIKLAPICTAYQQLQHMSPCVVVEGVGGWSVPLSDTLMQADLVRILGLPVILVVGMRLGCLNHALLSARAIADDGLKLAGWIANTVDPQMTCFEENLRYLHTHLPAPLLGVFPHQRRLHALELGKLLKLEPI